MPIVAVTGIGLVSPLGADPQGVARLLSTGEAGLRPLPALRWLPDGGLGGAVEGPDLKRWLLRRKDAKLLPRAAALALPAGGAALEGWPGDRLELGLFLGVGREPPDDGESEAALLAACRAGRLDDAALAHGGRDLYPPLLPLKTLPNMALAHLSINLGVHGENGTWAGGPLAGARAIVAALRAVEEGRCPAALAGAAESRIDLGSARDRLRMGEVGAPGEAAAMLLLEPLDVASARAARILAHIEVVAPGGAPAGETCPGPEALRAAIGDCGSAEGAIRVLLAVVAAVESGRHQRLDLVEPGSPPLRLQVRAPSAC